MGCDRIATTPGGRYAVDKVVKLVEEGVIDVHKG
jgi:hypothetical protein